MILSNRNYRTTLNLCFSMLAILATSESAKATLLSLDFSTLPSSQGFSYDNFGNPVPEGSIFSVDGTGTTLTQNSIGQPLVSPANNIYRLDGIVNSTDPFVLELRARVIDVEPLSPFTPVPFFSSVRTGAQRFELFFDDSTIRGPGGVVISTSIDTTTFHDYRIEGTPGNGTFDVFVDNLFLASATSLFDVSENYIGLGDPTGAGGNAHVEITRFDFTQVPEPLSSILLMTSLLLFIVSRRTQLSPATKHLYDLRCRARR